MRVALVHLRHRETGGTERYLQQMAAHLADAGHEVTVVCRSHERAPHPAVRFVLLRNLALGGAWRLWAFARAVERHVRASSYEVAPNQRGRCARERALPALDACDAFTAAGSFPTASFNLRYGGTGGSER